jgi:hypothetical protein
MGWAPAASVLDHPDDPCGCCPRPGCSSGSSPTIRGYGICRESCRPSRPSTAPTRRPLHVACLGNPDPLEPDRHRWAVGRPTWNRSAARATGQPCSTTQGASRNRPSSVSAASGWGTRTSWLGLGAWQLHTTPGGPHLISAQGDSSRTNLPGQCTWNSHKSSCGPFRLFSEVRGSGASAGRRRAGYRPGATAGWSRPSTRNSPARPAFG